MARLIIIAIAAFAIARLMGVFFESRRTSLFVMILSYVPFVFVRLWIAFWFDMSGWDFQRLLFLARPVEFLANGFTVILFTTLPTLFIISLNYKTTALKRAVVVFYSFVLWDVSTALATNFVVIHLPAVNFISFLPVANLAGAVLFFWVASMFRRFKHLKTDAHSFNGFWWAALATAVAINLFAIAIRVDATGNAINFSFTLINTISILLVFYLHHSISEVSENKAKSILHEKESEYYLVQCQLMQESVEQIKTIRHDMKMHLAAAMNYTANDRAKEATDYLRGLLGDIGESEVVSNSGNIAFDSIINFKLNKAKSENIKLDTTLLIPTTTNIEVSDIVTILGNLLDNALEAVAKVEDKLIRLTVQSSKGNLVIKADNTFDGVVKYKNRKDEAEIIIATRKDAGDHGHGLKSIRRSVEKYNGTVDITHDDNIFSVTVIIYLDKKI